MPGPQEDSGKAGAAAEPATGGDSSAATILIVDDAEKVRAAIRAALPEYRCLEKADVGGAREMLASGSARVDLVLLDLGAPSSEQIAFLEWARAEMPGVEMIMMSATLEERDVIGCLAQGATDFLHKPFAAGQLREAVRRVLRRLARQSGQPGKKAATSLIQALTPAEGWVELDAPSQFEFLGRLQRFTDVLFASRLSRENCEDLRMAMEEIGRNAIEWGNRLDPDKQLRISYCFFKDRVVLKFEDEGEGFRPSSLPDPSQNPSATLQKRMDDGKRPGGFGVFLVHSIMDEVVYSERGNVVLMTKFFG